MLASDGTQVGTVGIMLARARGGHLPRALIATPGHGIRFVEAADVASLHEHGVDLRIDAAAGGEPARAGARSARLRRGPRARAALAPLGAHRDRARRLEPRALSAQWARGDPIVPAGWHNRRMSVAARPGHGCRAPSPAPARARGADALAAGGALLPALRRAPRGGLRAAHALPARSRQDRALQGVPSPDAQDAGVRRAAGRSLPHTADAHARGDDDLAHRRARAARSTRTWSRRSGSATTSATRPSGTSARRCSTAA